jgi:flavin reductase (DIM6/NTAB) family NADH-FMN oxidoreductase RutF
MNAMPVPALSPSATSAYASSVLDAFANIASSVFIIATQLDGRRHGRTATSVAVIAVNPAEILVSIAKGRGMVEDIERAGSFSLALLATHQRDTADIFAGRAGLDGEDRFDPLHWRLWSSGNPFLEGAVVNLDCRMSRYFETDRNRLFLGRVIDFEIGRGAPLLYQRRGYQTLMPGEP